MTVVLTTSLTLNLRPASERDFVLASWRQLEERLGDRGIACSADWTAAWLDAYGDLVPHRFVLGHVGEELVAACLVCEGVEQQDGPLSVKSLHVGTAGEPDSMSACVEYNRLLVEPTYAAEFVRELVSYLNEQTSFDQWNLDGFDEDALAAFQDCEEKLELTPSVARYFDFEAARQKSDLLSALEHEPRRKAKKGLKHYGEVTLDWAESIDRAAEFLSDLMALHQARWQSLGKPGCYASERFVRFQEGLIARLVPAGRMVITRVMANGVIVGGNQIFFEQSIDGGRVAPRLGGELRSNSPKRALVYQCGWAPAPQGISPGVVVDYLNMDECLRRGIAAYDFMGHETQHKKDLSNSSAQIVWARKRAARLKFAALEQVRKLKRWLG